MLLCTARMLLLMMDSQAQLQVQENVQLQETLYTMQKFSNIQKLANVYTTIPKYAKVSRNKAKAISAKLLELNLKN